MSQNTDMRKNLGSDLHAVGNLTRRRPLGSKGPLIQDKTSSDPIAA